jgi:uncharacterized protein YciI
MPWNANTQAGPISNAVPRRVPPITIGPYVLRMWSMTRAFRLLRLLAFITAAISSGAQVQSQANAYFFVLLKRPPAAPQVSKETGDRIQQEHMANIRKMYDEHKLVIAGPFTDDSALRGIFVLHAESSAQAQEWANSDPAVQAGHLVAEVHGPWMIDPGAIHRAEDSNDMEQYTLVLMKRGQKWNPGGPGFMTVMKQHPAFVQQMMEQGKMAIAGPFPLSDAGDIRGIVIFRTGAEETAKLVQEDPTAKAGVLKPELHPWITGKGVLAAGQPFKMTD